MNFSLKIARIRGIDVFVHWTFLLLLGWIILSNMREGRDLSESLMSVWFVLALFGCVLLHELGHSLTAMRYGIGTKNIILLPIGGVANIEKMPDKPGQELAVALAGPAVNLVIAGVLFLILQLTGGIPQSAEDLDGQITGNNFLFNLLVVNVVLAIFNMIPAFPMDGGRVLRALLAMRYDRAKATNIAAKIGQVLAIAFVFAGFFYNFWWIFIGLFIFLGAGAEANFETTRSVLGNYKVRDVLMRQFTVFHSFETLDKAIAALLDGQEKEFLVEQDNEIIGILTRDEIIRGLREQGQGAAIGRIAHKNFFPLRPDMPLEEAYARMTQANAAICPVFENGQLLGVLNMENITEVVMLANAGLSKKNLSNFKQQPV
jgi:Zn-dependent protease/predicted transcriptional regulator